MKYLITESSRFPIIKTLRGLSSKEIDLGINTVFLGERDGNEDEGYHYFYNRQFNNEPENDIIKKWYLNGYERHEISVIYEDKVDVSVRDEEEREVYNYELSYEKLDKTHIQEIVEMIKDL